MRLAGWVGGLFDLFAFGRKIFGVGGGPGGVEIRAVGAGAGYGLVELPFLDGLVVAGEEYGRHLQAAKDIRLGVGGGFQQAVGKGFVLAAAGIPQGAGEEAGNGIYNDHGGDGSVGEDVVADGELEIHQLLYHAVVHPLIVTADDDVVGAAAGLYAGCCQLAGEGLGEGAPLRSHEDDARALAPQFLHGFKERLALHEHALTAAAEVVIRAVVFIMRPVAQLVSTHLHKPILCRAPHDALRERGGDDLREEG